MNKLYHEKGLVCQINYSKSSAIFPQVYQINRNVHKFPIKKSIRSSSLLGN